MKKIITLLFAVLFTPLSVWANEQGRLQALSDKDLEYLTIYLLAAENSCNQSEIFKIANVATKKELTSRRVTKSEEEKIAYTKLLFKTLKMFDDATDDNKAFLCSTGISSAYEITLPINALNMLKCSSLYAHKIILAKDDEDAVMKNGFLMSSFKNKGEMELEKHNISKIYSTDYYKAMLEQYEDLYSQNKPQYIVNASALDKACMKAIENTKDFENPNFGE